MHLAPPVRVSLGRSAAWAVAVGLAAGLAAANVAAWAGLRWEFAVWPGALTAGAAATVLCAWVTWRRQPQGPLAWDGARWYWQGAAAGDPLVMLDLDRWLLLRPSDGRWIVASRPRGCAAWPALRAALYSPRPAAGLDGPT